MNRFKGSTIFSRRAQLIFVSLVLVAGCAGEINSSFPTTLAEGREDLARMQASPKRLPRPLLIVGGFSDPGFIALALTDQFHRLSGDERIITISLGDCWTLQDCRAKIVGAVNRAFPSKDAHETIAVDVVGASLGGLAARYAADPTMAGSEPRLRIVRLFTISSPLQGACLAKWLPILHPMQADLRPDSAVIRALNSRASSYPIYPYVRLGDRAVGAAYAAPAGMGAWWVSTPFLESPHNGAFTDPRILADIARRIRGEHPLTTVPAARLP